MLRSLIIALLISLVVWLLTFDLFFSYARLPISLIVAIAAGLIAFVILRLLTKPGESAPPFVMQLIVPVLIAGGVLFATSQITAPSCGNTAMPVIQCGPARVAPDEVCVYKNGKIEWDTTAIPDSVTVRIYDFKKKHIFGDDPDQPLDYSAYTGTKATSPIRAKVRGNKEGYFKYTISCGGSDWKDPGIDVPRGH
jgi:hypothetical protein